MSEQSTLDRVRTILVDHLGVDHERVTENSDIISDLGADSLDQVEIVMAIEEEFGVEISDADIEGAFLVSDLVKLADGKVPA